MYLFGAGWQVERDPEAIWPLLLDIRAAGPTEEEGPDMSDKESVLEGIQKAIDMVSALCAGKQKWIMSITPQPERDPDMVIYRALTAARRLIEDGDGFGTIHFKRP